MTAKETLPANSGGPARAAATMSGLASMPVPAPISGTSFRNCSPPAGADVEHPAAGAHVPAGHVLVIPGHRITLVADRREIPATEFTGIPRDCP